MKVVVTGGTGFLGARLVNVLRDDGHEVAVLTRRAPRATGEVQWSPGPTAGRWATAFEGAGAVVNLAGEPIAEGRWTAARKQSILSSRLEGTRGVVAALRAAGPPGAVLLSGSAVGYYGTHRDEPLDESSLPGSDFLATVCREWEAEALEASAHARVVLLRTGFVVARDGGALPRLALPFHFFAGGPLGSGRQVMSWIHRDDWVAMVRWALASTGVRGPLNLTAPAPVTNREMAAAVGRALHRPSFMPAPGFALRLALGEMADALILNGQRVLPKLAVAGGFRFRYSTLDEALAEIYGGVG
ncbi:MAG TPA: TIGR01777 family oxidoreductase [Vicinamibacterales bacterium]|nr:TIGR01777 family oxidoreductase [Vicinamibacterales bacterium]